MKKRIIQFASLALAFVLILCFSVNSFAMVYTYNITGGVEVFLENTATFYYSAHRLNFSNNERGSCTFVAIAMLLSYYDTFWRDDIIPEEYDAQGGYYLNSAQTHLDIHSSPGVATELPSSNYDDCENYDGFIALYNDIYFQLKLMVLAEELFGCIKTNDTVSEDGALDSQDNYSLSQREMVELLEYYLYDYIGFTEEQIEVHSILRGESTDTIVRTKMIENINKGVPTIYSGRSDEGEGHAMVAYDYDEDEQNVYYHSGWSSGNRIINDEHYAFDYATQSSIIWLEINQELFPHVCSNNYKQRNGNGILCMCKFENHPVHNHTLTGEYLSHTSTNHIYKCVFCDGVSESHNFSYIKNSSTHHRIVCDCGYSSLEAHIAQRGKNICIICRAVLPEDYFGPVIMKTENLTTPTSYGGGLTCVSKDGIIILSDEDYLLLTSGALTTHAIYERLGLNYD